MTHIDLKNGVRIALLTGDNGEFRGFGEVHVGETLLRSAQAPMRVRFTTPDGYRYRCFTLREVEQAGDEVHVHLDAHGARSLSGDFCDDYEADLLLPSATQPEEVTDRLTWILAPCDLEIRDHPFTGFSYALEFRSDVRSLFRLAVECTWELGGSIEGVTHLHRGQCNPLSYVGHRDTFFSSSVLKSIGQPGEGQAGIFNHSMQVNSRHGTIQSFDYQYSPTGVLAGFWERGEYVRSLIQKNTGETVLFVLDEHHVPYGRTARTCAKQIVFSPITDTLQARDTWKDVKDHVHGGLEKQWGIAEMPLRTTAVLNESWIGNQPGAKCWYGDRAREVAPDQILRVLADEWLPEVKSAGLEMAGFAPFQESDITEMGRVCKLESGIHGDIMVSSVCNTWRYRPAAYWGGMDAWKYYADAAHALGLKAGIWVGNHMSHNAPVLQEHPEWFNIGRNTRPNAGGYTSLVMSPINWNSGFRQWILDDLKHWYDEGGLDYVWLDSWGNLAMLPYHYNDGFSNNLDGVGKFVAGLQEIGIHYMENEGMGPLCPPRFGLGSHQTQAEGQNSIFWWLGNEDMGDCAAPVSPGMGGLRGADLKRAHFRFFANYALYAFEHLDAAAVLALAEGDNYYAQLRMLWPEVRPHMHRRRRQTLPDQQGVLWTGSERRVLWAYKGLSLPLDSTQQIEQLYPQRQVSSGDVLNAPALSVHLISV